VEGTEPAGVDVAVHDGDEVDVAAAGAEGAEGGRADEVEAGDPTGHHSVGEGEVAGRRVLGRGRQSGSQRSLPVSPMERRNRSKWIASGVATTRRRRGSGRSGSRVRASHERC
jgi:hypothetical protein